MGETSGSAIRALSLGKPLVVSDVGWFSELPDDVALKVPPRRARGRGARGGARALAADEAAARRRWAPRPATSSSASTRSPHVAELYAAALEEAAGGDAVREAVLREVAEAAAEIGIDAGDPEAGELTAGCDEVGLGG